jgi:hypothetical protein
MPCRKLFSFCHCGGELRLVVENRVVLVVCRDCGERKPARDESAHPLLTPQNRNNGVPLPPPATPSAAG